MGAGRGTLSAIWLSRTSRATTTDEDGAGDKARAVHTASSTHAAPPLNPRRPTRIATAPRRAAEQPAACPPAACPPASSQLSMPSLPPVNFAFLMSAACVGRQGGSDLGQPEHFHRWAGLAGAGDRPELGLALAGGACSRANWLSAAAFHRERPPSSDGARRSLRRSRR